MAASTSRLRPAVRIREASPEDSAPLIELARVCPMRGRISIYAERSPDFFALERLRGDPWVVGVAEEEDGRIVGCVSVATRDVYLDGEPVRTMHTGDLRVAPGWRRTDVVHRLHAFCWERCRAAGLDFMYFSMMVGNMAVRSLLRPRPGSPVYRLAGGVTVLGIAPLLSRTPESTVEVRAASPADAVAIVELLDRENRRRNFAPVWSTDRLDRLLSARAGLSIADFRVARRGGRITGVLAGWEQREVQRTIVAGAAPWTLPFGALYSLVALLRGRRAFPGPGDELRLRYLSYLAVEDDDPTEFRSLIADSLRDPRSRDVHFLDLALDSRHPLLGALRGLAVQKVPTEVWTGAWPGSARASYDFTRRQVHHEASQVY